MSNLQDDLDPGFENFTIKPNQRKKYAKRYKEDEKRTHRTSTTKGRKRIRPVCLVRAMYVVPNLLPFLKESIAGGAKQNHPCELASIQQLRRILHRLIRDAFRTAIANEVLFMRQLNARTEHQRLRISLMARRLRKGWSRATRLKTHCFFVAAH